MVIAAQASATFRKTFDTRKMDRTAHHRVPAPPPSSQYFTLVSFLRSLHSTAENTRASFIEACKAGADGIETGELELVVAHRDEQ